MVVCFVESDVIRWLGVYVLLLSNTEVWHNENKGCLFFTGLSNVSLSQQELATHMAFSREGTIYVCADGTW